MGQPVMMDIGYYFGHCIRVSCVGMYVSLPDFRYISSQKRFIGSQQNIRLRTSYVYDPSFQVQSEARQYLC